MLATWNIVSALPLAFSALSSDGRGAFFADNGVFLTLTHQTVKQVTIDKQAFAEASTCLSWFYKGEKKPPPAAAQGINRRLSVALQPERDCPRHYPGGMEPAREDFARKQAMLSVSLRSEERRVGKECRGGGGEEDGEQM